ncbi:flagellar biosynthetic protein FliO [Devosia sp.]|uniref:flagellar biosynthetic protein FliO n=1 Tax=Devosia sp. TaxID=1871048 RepID=UPI003266A838
MQFITSLFGGSGNSILTSVFALGVVIVLIVLALWVFKMLFKASNNIGRGRNRRLAVVDTLVIDPKRQLVIIRRDNVEHLILTGGPQDLVVETGIPVEEVPAATSRRPVPSVPVVARPVPRPPIKPVVTPPIVPVTVVTPPTPIEPPAPAAEPAPMPPRAANSVTALKRLRDLGKPTTGRRTNSLRHTGLMRPVSQMEPASLPGENTTSPAPDSVKEIVNEYDDQGEHAERGESSGGDDSNGQSSDRN